MDLQIQTLRSNSRWIKGRRLCLEREPGLGENAQGPAWGRGRVFTGGTQGLGQCRAH